jgi:hypothetical protein
MIKFEKIQPGMTLYERRREQAGNTTMRVLGEWPVRILSVDPELRCAKVVWNGNDHRPCTYFERDLCKLYTWSMYDSKVAEVKRGLVGIVSARKRKAVIP